MDKNHELHLSFLGIFIEEKNLTASLIRGAKFITIVGIYLPTTELGAIFFGIIYAIKPCEIQTEALQWQGALGQPLLPCTTLGNPFFQNTTWLEIAVIPEEDEQH